MSEATAPVPDNDTEVDEDQAMPRIYVATPLTGLSEKRRKDLSYRVSAVKTAITEVTLTDRTDDDRWPVALHVPWEHTAPWNDSGLSPQTIYEHNLDQLLNSDGLIVVTDNTCSAGIGQEIEWAARAGIPMLYLSDTDASRQLRGNPQAIETRVCVDADDAGAHVRRWLARERRTLQKGPGRRIDRDLSYVKVTAQLEVAWRATRNPTAVAAQLGLHPNVVWHMVGSPARVALTPWWTVCELAAALGISLDARRSLTFSESRAWIRAMETGSWSPRDAERVRSYALATQNLDFELPSSWALAYERMRRAGGFAGPTNG